MKAIFLDMDGVLVTMRSHLAAKEDGFMRHIDLVGCKLLERLCRETGAKIVLSSTWRLHFDKPAMSMILCNGGFSRVPWHEQWRTPQLLNRPRGHEIASWLEDNPVEKFVIIDDDPDMTEAQKPFFVQTNGNNGILYDDYLSAKSILGGV